MRRDVGVHAGVYDIRSISYTTLGSDSRIFILLIPPPTTPTRRSHLARVTSSHHSRYPSLPQSFTPGRLKTHVSIYIKLPRLYVCVCVCLVFRISEKRADRFPCNFAWFIGVIGRRERIKTSGKFRPLMCNNSKKRCKIADFEKVLTGDARWRAQWPAVRVRELA